MPHRPPRKKKTQPQPGELPGKSRFNHDADHRQRDMATRSMLSRLRNRKSDLK
jgi:hypothetical protein